MVSIIMFSCKKEVIQKEISKTTIEQESIETVNLKTIPIKEGILQFTSFNQFNNAIMQIQKECNEHTKKYCIPLSEEGLTEEQVNEKAQKDGFDQFKPISDFENITKFKSLYSILRLEEKEWFKNETLNENNDPFSKIERYEAVFCNQDGIVSINGENINLYNANFNSLKSTNAPTAYHSANHYKSRYFSSNPKKMKGNVGPRWYHAISSTTLYGKNIWGNWYLYMSRVSATVHGKVHTINAYNECNHYVAATTVPFKQSVIWWSAYVYNASWHSNVSDKGSERNEGILKSQHLNWGKSFNHAF